ncbi:hypothetical protein [Lacinutrix jangbogonensis]|uniref:hypothetical protein n=1 Tax=Lacinutrix jangbogonensis TaxID=1469557 RepID=UPI00053E3184|nr:hypothetical protein [Lacinutrix jangbogonensis]
MGELKIYYKQEEDVYFKDQDVNVKYYIHLNFKSKEVRWCFYLPLPKGIHWKAGDLMGGLGVDHHTKTQSFEDFILKPHLEILKKEYKQASRVIKNSLV